MNSMSCDLFSALRLARAVDPTTSVEITTTKHGSYVVTVRTNEDRRCRCKEASILKATQILCAIARVEPCPPNARLDITQLSSTFREVYLFRLEESGFIVSEQQPWRAI
mgnify:FL=1